MKDDQTAGRKRLRTGSVSFNPGIFDRRSSKAIEARVSIYFATASTAGAPAPMTVPHALGKSPVTYEVVRLRRDPALGPPGTVFDMPPWGNDHYITLLCSTDATTADIIIR